MVNITSNDEGMRMFPLRLKQEKNPTTTTTSFNTTLY